MIPVVVVLLFIGAVCLILSVLDVVMGGDMVELGLLGLCLIFIAFVVDIIWRSVYG